MESRKLQVVGGGASFAVSLPKQWVESQGLRAGDELMIEGECDGCLRIHSSNRPEVQPQERMMAVRSSDPDEILRSLIGLYVNVFDRLTIEHNDIDPGAVMMGVEQACTRLTGLQVLEEDDTHTVLQDLSDTRLFNLDKGLRRMQTIVQQMIGNAVRLIEGGGETILQQSERYETELDRLALLLMKQFTGCLHDGRYTWASGASPLAGLHCMFVAQFLERIGDYAIHLSRFSLFLAANPDECVAGSVRESLDALQELVGDAVRSFNTKDPDLANAVIRRVQRFAPTADKDHMFDIFTAPRTQAQVGQCHRCIKYFTLLECIERVALYAKSIAETAINWSMVAEPTR